MKDDPQPAGETVPGARALSAVRLVGFSIRDRELLRLFLRRPPGAGVSLSVVDGEADLLIANTATPEARDELQNWSTARPAIGIVERFEREATYYQIAQDGQLLFSLAQAINRIRSGWTPPVPPPEASEVDEVSASPRPADDTPVNERVAEATTEASALTAPVSGPVAAAEARMPAPAPVAPAGNAAAIAAAIGSNTGLPWQRALDILVIDDSHFSREAISQALIKVGFAVDTAEDGAAGLRLASEKLFDVALVDFEMPGMQGPEVLRKLRALGPAKAPTLLIMLTSRTGAVDRLRAKFAGCDAYMTKPTRMQEFLKILRDFAVAGKLTRP
jgi:CheY-like chemotaxis protein